MIWGFNISVEEVLKYLELSVGSAEVRGRSVPPQTEQRGMQLCVCVLHVCEVLNLLLFYYFIMGCCCGFFLYGPFCSQHRGEVKVGTQTWSP